MHQQARSVFPLPCFHSTEATLSNSMSVYMSVFRGRSLKAAEESGCNHSVLKTVMVGLKWRSSELKVDFIIYFCSCALTL